MQAKWEQGIKFLESTESDWKQASFLSCHNYWHLGLYYIESGQFDYALKLYDANIGSRWERTGSVLDGVDAASFLQRLQIQGVDVGRRWLAVNKQWQKHREDHILNYNDTHIMFAACGSQDNEIVYNTRQSILEYAQQGNDLQAGITRDTGLNLVDGIVAYWDKRYDDAVQLMMPVRYNLRPMGGSNAQRDVFSQLLIKSAVESSSYKMLANSLIEERRCLRNERSPLTERFQQRLSSQQ
eukprot:TRINITY_DN2969_c0_g4_i4.p1 TRINITY_DN2969_c0_g4~~TRINITY_DN2969_c0_g4_i4.p1  ORF type:complete len:275 (+),score=4.09 TRINITY_DN2969_c0_g4_i4:106-825(+)